MKPWNTGIDGYRQEEIPRFLTRDEQRLGLAIALLTRPDLMILDEPINGLDPVGIKEFRQLVQRLNEELGMTFIISSHILSELT